jgi:hypothetical protein
VSRVWGFSGFSGFRFLSVVWFVERAPGGGGRWTCAAGWRGAANAMME